MTNRQRWLLGFLGVALLSVPVGIAALSSAIVINRSYHIVPAQIAPAIRVLEEIKVNVEDMGGYTKSFFAIMEEQKLAPAPAAAAAAEEGFLSAKKRMGELEVRYQVLADLPREKKTLEEIVSLNKRLGVLNVKLMNLKKQGLSGENILAMIGSIEKMEAELTTLLDAAITGQEAQLVQQGEYADRVVAAAGRTLIFSCLAVVVLAVGLGCFIPIRKET